jgi:hypothetical protein
VREQDQAGFGAWLDRCRDGPLSGLAEGLRRDRALRQAAQRAIATAIQPRTEPGLILLPHDHRERFRPAADATCT